MPLTGASNTPQPMRTSEWSQRYAYESELWDDYANSFYYIGDDGPHVVAPNTNFTTPAVTVPCLVATRLFIAAFASYDFDAFTGPQSGDIFIIIDGGTPISYGHFRVPKVANNPDVVADEIGRADIIDIAAGPHTVALQVATGAGAPNVEWTILRTTIRRGRKPVT